jgi:hypothetical protein
MTSKNNELDAQIIEWDSRQGERILSVRPICFEKLEARRA